MSMIGKVLYGIGDCDPVEHGGGVVVESDYGTRIEYTHGVDEYPETSERLTIYRVDIDQTHWLDWADLAKVEQSCSMSGLAAISDDSPLRDRVALYEAVASYYGWHELDQYPVDLSASEAVARWELDK